MRTLISIFIFIFLSVGATAQPRYIEPGSARDTSFIKGDTIRARTAMHHTEDTATQLRVQLGYIDADSATVQQVRDNMAVGIRVVRFGNYKVVQGYLGILPKGGDYIPGTPIKGGRFRYSDFDSFFSFNRIKPGDRLAIDATIQRDGASYVLKIKGPLIRVVP